MREYLKKEENKLSKVICNGCGKTLKVEKGYLTEGCFSAKVDFGYFSRKDGTRHSFDLCEDCYDKMIASFRVPVQSEEITELLGN